MLVEGEINKKKRAVKKTAIPTDQETTVKKKPDTSISTRKKAATKKIATKTTSKKAVIQSNTTLRAAEKKIKEKETQSMGIGEEHINHNVMGPVSAIPRYEAKPDEVYMNDRQLQHFTQVLLTWRRNLLKGVDKTVVRLKKDAENHADLADRATQEEEFNLELRTRDRERKLLKKIEDSNQRINDGHFGYCVACGVEIGLLRLEVRPTATLCIDCKTVEEIREKQTIL